MIVNIEDNQIVVNYREDGTTVEARSEPSMIPGGETNGSWLSTCAFGDKTADAAREISREYGAIAIFLEREKLAKEEAATETTYTAAEDAIASKLRQAYYEDASATIDKSEHPEQWFRMARAALKKD